MKPLPPERLALTLGLVSLALILGALFFEYALGYPPCELCLWQRWPHYAAIVTGLLGGAAVSQGIVQREAAVPLAALTALLMAGSGIIAVFHSGVEWHFWPGPAHCTGNAVLYTGGHLDLNARGPMCDIAAWRLFGISMAGYNALISLFAAASGFYLLLVRGSSAKAQ